MLLTRSTAAPVLLIPAHQVTRFPWSAVTLMPLAAICPVPWHVGVAVLAGKKKADRLPFCLTWIFGALSRSTDHVDRCGILAVSVCVLAL